MAEKQIVETAIAQANWNEILGEVEQGRTRVLVQKDGAPVAALVPAADLAYLEGIEEARARRFAVVGRIRDAFSEVPDDQLQQEIERAVAEARTEIRPERQAGR
jgi:prevent-host-death family protein